MTGVYYKYCFDSTDIDELEECLYLIDDDIQKYWPLNQDITKLLLKQKQIIHTKINELNMRTNIIENK
ncbi:hypothetical protein ACFSCX_06170 [Bacillus salitolerans]|uniref:Uncharacterized protein n=1 Tax=Bacillus salitolerans TaxID=1437434 RepID=A0ABW4LM10_9BACI